MSYPENIVRGKWGEVNEEDLINVLITLDGLGQEKKRQVLAELLKRASERTYEIIRELDG